MKNDKTIAKSIGERDKEILTKEDVLEIENKYACCKKDNNITYFLPKETRALKIHNESHCPIDSRVRCKYSKIIEDDEFYFGLNCTNKNIGEDNCIVFELGKLREAQNIFDKERY